MKTRTIIGSIARQILEHSNSDVIEKHIDVDASILDTDEIITLLGKLLPTISRKHIVVLDGLDECEESEARSLLEGLKQLLASSFVFQIYCSSRPDVFRWASVILKPLFSISIPKANPGLPLYVENTLERCLEARKLCIGDPSIIFTIQDALVEKANGMSVSQP